MGNDGNGSAIIDSVVAEADTEQQVAQTETPAAQQSAAKPPEKNILAEIYEAKKVHDVIPRIKKDIGRFMTDSGLADKYSIFFLYDDGTNISRGTSNQLYSAMTSRKEPKPLYLLIHSGGGKIEPAYLISKCCKSYSGRGFVVSVPRFAKSAATLLALGADEIHMGVVSDRSRSEIIRRWA